MEQQLTLKERAEICDGAHHAMRDAPSIPYEIDKILRNYRRDKTDLYLMTYADTLALGMGNILAREWAVFYEALAYVKKNETWKRTPIYTDQPTGEKFKSFEQYFESRASRPFSEFIALEKTYRFAEQFAPELLKETLEKATSRREQAEATQAAVAQAIADQPTATQQQIAEKVGVSQQRVSQLTSEIQAKSEPKLLKHGGKVTEQGSHTNVDRGVNRDYILARLKRDGFEELAQQVKAGAVSARKAGMQAGFVKPESALVALKRHWRKASTEERQQFMSWVESGD